MISQKKSRDLMCLMGSLVKKHSSTKKIMSGKTDIIHMYIHNTFLVLIVINFQRHKRKETGDSLQVLNHFV